MRAWGDADAATAYEGWAGRANGSTKRSRGEASWWLSHSLWLPNSFEPSNWNQLNLHKLSN